MIFREALRSLKNSRAKAVFYWLTFFITTALLFVYFNMEYASTQGKSEIYMDSFGLADIMQLLEKGNAGNLMMVFVVIMCAIDLLFCNDFFVKNKAKELAVRLICGATYIQLAMYLLIQTVVLLLAAVPLGIAAGYGLLGLMNRLLAAAGETMTVTVSSYAIAEFTTVLTFIVFWTVLLNCSFAYKSGAVLLAGGNMSAMKDKGSYGLGAKKYVRYLLNLGALVLTVLPLYNFFNGSGALAVSMVIGSVGLSRVISEIFLPFLTGLNRRSASRNTVRMTANGFLRQDLKYAGITIYLLLCDLMIVMTMMFSRNNTSLEYLLVIVTYISISILQSLALMFRLETDISSREKQFVILSQVGVSAKEQKSIIQREVMMFYLLTGGLIALYGGTALYSLSRDSLISGGQMILLISSALIPVIVIAVLTYLYYLQVAAGAKTARSEQLSSH